MEFHPAAEMFPLLDDKRMDELVDDIRQNGQREPIRVFDGKVLDGRNRYRACDRLRLVPRTETIPAGINPWAYVWSLNGERRDLTSAQRYGIWKRCHERSEAWQAEQARIRDEANRKRSEATKTQPRKDNGKMSTKPVVPQVVGQPARDHQAKHAASSTTAKATASKTNRGTVERMDRLERERPDLFDAVIQGKATEAAAVKELVRQQTVTRLESIEVKQAKAIEGVYDVLVIDPPWPMEKIERDCRPNQVEFDYPTMTESELAAMRVPAADDCHVWVWTTHRFLPMALRLLDAWGLKYVCTFVWHKPGGFQPVGLPQFNCEFALYARKGAPKFIDTKALNVCFEAPRGKHSEKPESFYETVRRITAGRRLDMFSRRVIEGFEGWGLEAK